MILCSAVFCLLLLHITNIFWIKNKTKTKQNNSSKKNSTTNLCVVFIEIGIHLLCLSSWSLLPPLLPPPLLQWFSFFYGSAWKLCYRSRTAFSFSHCILPLDWLANTVCVVHHTCISCIVVFVPTNHRCYSSFSFSLSLSLAVCLSLAHSRILSHRSFVFESSALFRLHKHI